MHKKRKQIKRKHIPKKQLTLFPFTWKKNIFSRKLILRKLKKVSHWIIQRSKYYKASLGIILLWICIYTIFFSSLMRVTEINIYRKDSLSNIDAAYRTIHYIRNKKIFSINKNDIVSRLYKSQKSLQYITLKKSLNGTLDITLESYTPVFQQENTLILENGAIIPKNNGFFDEIHTLQVSQIPDNDEILNYKHLEKIDSLIETLKKNILSIEFNTLYYYTLEEEVLFQINNNSILIFDLEKNLEEQIEKLSIFHQEQHNIIEKPFVYLDLRINGKIYSCESEETINCSNTLKKLYNIDSSTLLLSNSSQNQQ